MEAISMVKKLSVVKTPICEFEIKYHTKKDIDKFDRILREIA